MQIFVKLVSGPTITLDVEKNDSIKIIKEKVIEKEGIPCIHMFRLYYYEKLLEDYKTLQDYNIGKESTLKLFRNYRYSKLNLRIFYNKNILDVIDCNICVSSTVLDIKKLITEKFKIKQNKMIIICNDQILDDGMILKNIKKDFLSYSNGYLELFVAKNGVPFVKVINDKDPLITFNLLENIDHQSSINIKKSIEKYYGLPIINQTLLFEDGHEESAHCCNFYYDIKNRNKNKIIRKNNNFFAILN